MIELILGKVNQGKTSRLVSKIVSQAKLHGGRSIIFTNEGIPSRVIEQYMTGIFPEVTILNGSLQWFYEQIMSSDIDIKGDMMLDPNAVIRVGLDFSTIKDERVIQIMEYFDSRGYEVYATGQTVRKSMTKCDSALENLFS